MKEVEIIVVGWLVQNCPARELIWSHHCQCLCSALITQGGIFIVPHVL